MPHSNTSVCWECSGYVNEFHGTSMWLQINQMMAFNSAILDMPLSLDYGIGPIRNTYLPVNCLFYGSSDTFIPVILTIVE